MDEYISTIKKYIGDRDKYEKPEIIEFISRSKDIPNKLANTLFKMLNGIKDLNLLEYEEKEELKNLHGAFNKASIEFLGKSVKYKQNVLFHLLRKIGKEPDINHFYFQGSASVKKTDEEIKKVFNRLGWEFRPM